MASNRRTRARKIGKALRALYEDYTKVPVRDRSSVMRQNVVDALTDLRHFADESGVDFYAAIDSSYNHYLAETTNTETPG